MQKENTRLRNMVQFTFIFLVISFALFITYYGQEVRRYNTTALAINYSHGFVSRGLLGTLLLWLNDLLPYDILNYESIVNLTLITTTIVVSLFFILALLILKKTKELYLTNTQYLLIFFTMFFVSMFYSFRNMGRPDIYMLFLVFLGLILIIIEKAEWLIIPFSILCVMIHQGYVFLFYNIFLYPLFYKACKYKDKKRIKYLVILGISFLSVSILFLYFNFFSHKADASAFDEIWAYAASLGNNGEVYETLLTHEILGIDPWKEEWPYHIYNFIELSIFIPFMLPYIILGIRLFKNIIKAAETVHDKIRYAFLPLCSLTALPLYILKIDYGRWIFAGVAYFTLMLLTMLALKDELVSQKLHELMEDIKARYSYACLLLIYIGNMIPMHDIHINTVLRHISEWLEMNYLHIFG